MYYLLIFIFILCVVIGYFILYKPIKKEMNSYAIMFADKTIKKIFYGGN